MLPFVVTEIPGSPIQVCMAGSVGAGGTNQFADVQLVQSLLGELPRQPRPSFLLEISTRGAGEASPPP